MRIVYIATEVVPYAKTGGLADVAGALPKALAELGVHVDVILPKYSFIDHTTYGLEKLSSDGVRTVPMGYGNEGVGVWGATLPGSTIRVFFIEHFWFFDRPGLYVDPITGDDYSDNAARFAYLSRASLEVINAFDLRPDVIHCNDYQTALVPAYLKLAYANDPVFADVATLYTIHNIQYQGRYPREAMGAIAIGYAHFYPGSPFECWEEVNLMKVGLEYADLLNTVSPRYAQEIQGSLEDGHGLDGVLRSRSDDLYGIVNGIDYTIWNPSHDPLIPYPYDAGDFSGKARNKAALLAAFGLEAPPETPVIGIVSRLASQKGFDIIGPVLDSLLKLDLRIVVLGTGDQRYHELFEWVQLIHPDKLGIKLTFDDQLAHLIEAGADLFLMPSQYEPCGLNQLYSLRYGTLPVVRETGGLADTVRPYSATQDTGTGFMFQDYTPEALLDTLLEALTLYRDQPGVWRAMMRRAMAEDFSWTASARQYIGLYEKAIEQQRNKS